MLDTSLLESGLILYSVTIAQNHQSHLYHSHFLHHLYPSIQRTSRTRLVCSSHITKSVLHLLRHSSPHRHRRCRRTCTWTSMLSPRRHSVIQLQCRTLLRHRLNLRVQPFFPTICQIQRTRRSGPLDKSSRLLRPQVHPRRSRKRSRRRTARMCRLVQQVSTDSWMVVVWKPR